MSMGNYSGSRDSTIYYGHGKSHTSKQRIIRTGQDSNKASSQERKDIGAVMKQRVQEREQFKLKAELDAMERHKQTLLENLGKEQAYFQQNKQVIEQKAQADYIKEK